MMRKVILVLILLLFLVSPASALWNTSYPNATFTRVANPNTTTIYVDIINSNCSSNSTSICGSFIFNTTSNTVNSTHAVVDNTTEIPFYVNNISGNIANVSVNVSTVNSTNYVGIYSNGQTDYGSVSNFKATFMGGGDYVGTVIDITRWNVVGSSYRITQNNRLLVTGDDTWVGVVSVQNFSRPFVYKTYFTTNSTSAAMFGIKDTTAGFAHTDYVYGFNLDGGEIRIREDGNERGSFGTFAVNTDYWFMIEVLNTGAKYYNSTDNGTTWNLRYTSTYSTENPLKIVATQWYPATLTQLDDTIVYNATSPMPTWTGWGATEEFSINIISWGNNYTNNQDLSISVPQNTIVNFNITTDVPASYYNWTVNGANQSHNQSNFTLVASSLIGYTVIGFAYNTTTLSMDAKTWNVNVTALNYISGEGQLKNDTVFVLGNGNGANITVLAIQNFTRIELLNNTQIPSNTLWFTINNSNIQFNTTSDKTISKISYTNPYWNFTLNSGIGYLNIYANMTYPNITYNIFKDGINVGTNNTNSTNWIRFNISGIGNYSIQLDTNTSLLSPTNTSSQLSPIVNLQWIGNGSNIPSTYQLSTDSQYLNIISQGSGSFSSGVFSSGNINLQYNTKYYWHAKSYTGSYVPSFEFTVLPYVVPPGQLNITVFDEQNISKKIMNFSTQVQNSTSSQSKTTTTGWTNFSGAEVITGQYLVVITPSDSDYSCCIRMILVSSPANVTMYVPNSTAPNTVVQDIFSLSDITGRFPYLTSVITVLRAGLIQESSYFNLGNHPVYLIKGTNYQIQITNGNNIFITNYIPVISTSETIVINDFEVNNSEITQFTYDISQTKTQVLLNWNDSANYLNILNFTVYKNLSLIEQCNKQTSVKAGQYACPISGNDKFYIVFSAVFNDGTFQNRSYWFDNVIGQIPVSIGVNPIDGSPMGTGFNIQYGTFTMPRWVTTLFTAILIILLLGTFGAKYGELGVVVSTVFAVFFAEKGWFAPLGTGETEQGLVISLLTSLLVIFAISYIAKNNTGSSMMAYKMTMFLVFTNFGIAIADVVVSNLIFPQNTIAIGTTNVTSLFSLNTNSVTFNNIKILGINMSLTTLLFTSSLLALFAFSLLPVTIPIVNAFFSLSFVFSGFYITKLGLTWYFTAPLIVGIAIIYMMGMTQFASRQTAQGV